MQHTRKGWKQMIPPVLWSLAGVALCTLLISAVQRNNQLRCKDPDIVIEGFKNEMFISEADVQAIIEKELGQKIKGCSIEKLDLRTLESKLQQDSWIHKAQLYVDNRQVLHITVNERLPVARIFTVANRSFYIDSEAVELPLSQYEVADVPVFTNVPDRGKMVTPGDSIFWRQISSMGSYISKDTFLLLQVGQVSVTPEREMEIYPVLGNHIVRFGSPENYIGKFIRLSSFYEQVLAKAGLNKYSVVDLRYDKQVVARLRNTADMLHYEPQIQIQQDRVAAMITEEPQQLQPVAAKKESGTEKKPDRVAATPEKQKPKTPVAKAEKRETVQTPEKIIIASNNKADQKKIKQLPRKTEKPGLVELDIRTKHQSNLKSGPKAIMPKKGE